MTGLRAVLQRKRTGTPAYYVATNGNDTWTGLLPAPNAGNTDGPFLTITKAQTSTHSGTIKRVVVRSGTYTLGANLVFTSSDNGCYWVTYQNELVTINGASSFLVSSSGITTGSGGLTIKGFTFNNLVPTSGNTGFTITGSGYRILWNTFTNCTQFILGGGNCDNSLIDSNTFVNQTPGNTVATTGLSCINFFFGSSDLTISHNLVNGAAGGGIDNAAGLGDPTFNNTIIDRNLLVNTCYNTIDNGALYFLDRNGTTTGGTITNNLIVGCGSPLSTTVKSIYIDEFSCNNTVSGNLVVNVAGQAALQNHGGSNDHFTNNAFVILPSTELGFYQTSGQTGANVMSGNTFQHNIVYYTTTAVSPQWQISGTPLNFPSDSNNLYFSGNSSSISNTGSIVDSAPVNLDPQFVNPKGNTTNAIRNSILLGAIPGTFGSGGSLWTNSGSNFGTIPCDIVGTGFDVSTRHFYVDLRFHGTPPVSGQTFLNVDIDIAAPITVAAWTASMYWSIVAGATTNIGQFVLSMDGNSTGSFQTFGTPTSTPTLISATGTFAGGNTTSEVYFILQGFTADAAHPIDITLRIQAPQLELGSSVTSFKQTPNYALKVTSPAYAQLGWTDIVTDQGPLTYVPES